MLSVTIGHKERCEPLYRVHEEPRNEPRLYPKRLIHTYAVNIMGYMETSLELP